MLEVDLTDAQREVLVNIVESEDWRNGMMPYLNGLVDKYIKALVLTDPTDVVTVARLQDSITRTRKMIGLRSSNILRQK